MKIEFVEPVFEIIHFGNDVIRTSECGCYDGMTDWGAGADSTCPNLNLPECQCKLNTTNPDLGNCV